jgi:hypothetical protein
VKTRIAFTVLLVTALSVTAAATVPFIVAGWPFAIDLTLTTAVLVLAAILLHLVGHLVRAEKHAVLLREIRPIRRAQVFRGQMIGFMFNALLPLRVGELMRAHYVGRSVQISRSAVLATIVLERTVDLVTVTSIGAAPLLPLVLLAAASAVGLAAILVVCFYQPRWFLAAVFQLTGLFNVRISTRLRQIAWSFCHALAYALPDRRMLLRYAGLAAVMWSAYFGSLVLVVSAVVRPERLPQLVLPAIDAPFLVVSGIATPASLGGFLDELGSTVPAAAVGFAFLAWLVLTLPSIAIGSVCLLHRQLVQHAADVPAAPALRNKLFRDVFTSDEFTHMLTTHFQGDQLARIISREEAAGRFTVVKPLKGGSNATTLLVWQGESVVVKKVTLPQYRSKLESQHRWLAERANKQNLVNVHDTYDGGDHYSIDIEFREEFVAYFEYLHSVSKDEAWSVLSRLLDFVDDELYEPRPVRDAARRLDSYIDDKVLGKVQDTAAMSKSISQLRGYDFLVVNGERMLGLDRVIEAIRRNPRAMEDLVEFDESPIHGDMTIDNLMVEPSSGKFMLIDPNDENSISDSIVDYGKLLQSLDAGYEFLVMHDRVSVEKNAVTFEERRSAHYEALFERCLERFEQTLTPGRYRALLFHEAVHYCRMLTYRASINPSSVPLFFGVAVRLFNRFIEQYRTPEGATEAVASQTQAGHRAIDARPNSDRRLGAST